MRPGIALLRSTNVLQLEIKTITLYLGYCCKWNGEDILWAEESQCPYRQECDDRFVNLGSTKHIKKGGVMVIKKAATTLYTVRDVAGILECKQSHVMKLIRSGALKAEKHGWVWAISSDDLEEYQKKNN